MIVATSQEQKCSWMAVSHKSSNQGIAVVDVGGHLYLAESNPQTRHEWMAALDTIEALKPRAVIAGHKKPENDDSPRIIEETRQYIPNERSFLMRQLQLV